MNSNNGQAIISNEQDLEHQLKSNPQAMVLFYSSWCPFCRRFLPVFEKYARENQGSFSFCIISDQDAMEDRYRVNIVPTVLFYENGVVAKRLDGVTGVGIYEKQLADFINTCSLRK